MLTHISGPLHAVELPEVGFGGCCMGSAAFGPDRCTCWEEVYDLKQRKPRPAAPKVRATACADCAYRPDSPERNGAKGYAGDADRLDDLALGDQPFYCHQGIRRAVKLRHPEGVEIDAHPASYRPPMVDRVPYRADGKPAEICAGWAARATKAGRARDLMRKESA